MFRSRGVARLVAWAGARARFGSEGKLPPRAPSLLHAPRPEPLETELGGPETESPDLEFDRSGLLRPVQPLVDEAARERLNPLAQELYDLITMKGSMTVADYMHYCLLHPTYGYYTTKPEKIGRAGDFVTAPELTSIFSELICVWAIGLWQLQGDPAAIRLVEMGPGKGTLVRDYLRTAAVLPRFHEAIQNGGVHLVEPSPTLRQQQRDALVEEFGAAEHQGKGGNDKSEAASKAEEVDGVAAPLLLANGLAVAWHATLAEVPPGPTFFVGHELLDAFPVHQFIRLASGWRERLIEPTFVGQGAKPTAGPAASPTDEDDFRLVASEQLTAALQLVPEVPEAEALTGMVVEACPAALELTQAVAKRIAEHGGAALLVDYGGEGTPRESVRGFLDHKEVSWLRRPGELDITADVDFAALKRAVSEIAGVAAVGTVEQGAFLGAMGIKERTMALMDDDKVTDEDAEKLYNAFVRLVGADQMGARYKVLAIVPEELERLVPGISPGSS